MPSPQRKASKNMKRLLRVLGSLLLLPIIFFEEWGWKPLARFMAKIARLPLIGRLESKISNAPPRLALAFFLIPAIVLLPFKFSAFWLIAHGQKFIGLAVILTAKLVSTALLGRLFHLTERQLMSFAWFARAYTWWRVTKDRLVAKVKATAAWQSAAALGRSLRAWFKKK
jgi:hypothetical protein